MTVEVATYISDLNTANPGATDLKAEGDDHLRLIKTTVKATFPNITGAVTPTHTVVNNLAAGTFPTGVNVIVGASSAVSKFTVAGTQTSPTTSGAAANAILRVFDAAGSRSTDMGVSSTSSWIQCRDKNDYSISYDLALQQNGGAVVVGLNTGVQKFSVAQPLAAPSTSGLAANGHIRVFDVAGSRAVDHGVSASFGWIQSRDTNAYATNYDLAIQPNGGSTFVGVSASCVTVASDGRMFGKALHNNAGAVTGTTNQYVASGTYTPTVTGVTNYTSSTPRAAQWMRVGNVVTVSAQIDVTTTAASAQATIGVSLPIASSLANSWELVGTMVQTSTAGTTYPVGTVNADATNDRANVDWTTTSSGVARTMTLTFTYVVL